MKQILIIEDDTALNQGLCKALKTDSRKLISCETIKAARDQLLCGCPSLILLDINLSDGSGLDFLQELKRELPAKTTEHVYRKGCYEFDFERMIFIVNGQEIELSKTEQRLLRLLVQNEGINLRRDFLLDRVWNDSAEFVDANALSVSIKRLRDKLGTPDSIKTVYGIGYRFE